MPNRKYQSSSAYRYGFNGKENDNETVGTGEGTQDYGMRIYNPSLGRWLSLDPLMTKYPSLSPYNFVNNNPIFYVDPTGEDYIAYLFTVKRDGSIDVKVTQYWPSWDGPLEGRAVEIQYEGSPDKQTYDFTNFGTLGHNNGQKGGTGNNIDQFETFIKEFGADPEATLKSDKYITQTEMKIGDIKAIATAFIIGRLVKQRAVKNAEIKKQQAAANNGVKTDGEKLNWTAVVPKKGKYAGQLREDHVKLHNTDNKAKPDHGVFSNADGINITNNAWNKAQTLGLKPDAQGNLVVPYQNAGKSGGSNGDGSTLNNVTIVVVPGTANIITSYPSK